MSSSNSLYLIKNMVLNSRFGLIRGLRAQYDIEKDSELLVNYGINLADSPEWYRVVWIRHYREVKQASDASIARILERYAENTGKRVEIPECTEFQVPEPQVQMKMFAEVWISNSVWCF